VFYPPICSSCHRKSRPREPILDNEADIVTGTKQGLNQKAFVSGVYTSSAVGCSAFASRLDA